MAATQGTLHAGAACATDAECISQNCQIPACNLTCCTGTCQGDTPPVLAKLGESCANFPICDPEAFCDPASMMCVALKGLGESCTVGGIPCADGLYCLNSTTKTCGFLPGLGEPCTNDGCREVGLTCSETSKTCVKEGLLGDPCGAGAAECSDLYVCDASNRCSAGIPLGGACVMFDRCADPDAFCDVPANATMGTCTAPKPNGASCRTHFDCASDVCDPTSNTCVADMPCD